MSRVLPSGESSSGEDWAWDEGLRHVFGGGGESSEALDEPPSSCGRYRILEEIARGGMGIIHKARDETLGRDVAIKVLKERYADNQSMVARFLEEAQIGGQLQHPGIVPVYDMGLDSKDRPYFCMKLIRGLTLSALLKGRSNPSEDRVRYLGIFESICQTLAYSHDLHVIHRDLKPHNIMVGAFGEVQVMDWGFAKILGVESPEASTAVPETPSDEEAVRTWSPGSGSVAGSVLGTPGYMPPEQARGQVESMDERSDVFSLGAILFEILTGAPPYPAKEGVNSVELAAAADLSEAFELLSQCPADEELIDLARWCLQPEIGKRPQSAGVVSEAIADYISGVEERAQAALMAAAEARGLAVQELRVHRLAMVVTALILVGVVLVGGVLWWLDAVRRRSPDDAVAKPNPPSLSAPQNLPLNQRRK